MPRASYQWSRKEICVKEADEIFKIKKKNYRTSGIIRLPWGLLKVKKLTLQLVGSFGDSKNCHVNQMPYNMMSFYVLRY